MARVRCVSWSAFCCRWGPAVATVAIFSFLGHWNSFLYPMIYLNTMDKFTLPIGLRYQLAAYTGGGPKSICSWPRR